MAQKYTHKEINDASMAARKAAELIYTDEKVRAMHPINTTLHVEERLMTTNWNKREYIKLDRFIEQLQEELRRGATHFELTWSTAEWCEDDPADVEFVKMKTETQAEWDFRIEQTREKYLQDAYRKVQSEMLKYNEDLNLFLALKDKFEPKK